MEENKSGRLLNDNENTLKPAEYTEDATMLEPLELFYVFIASFVRNHILSFVALKAFHKLKDTDDEKAMEKAQKADEDKNALQKLKGKCMTRITMCMKY